MGRLSEVAVLKGHEDIVWSLSWHPSGKILASCGGDKQIRLWIKDNTSDKGEWKCATVLSDAHTRTIRSVSWSPCGKFLASSSFDATTCIWDKVDGEYDLAATLEGHENEVKKVRWSPDGAFLATCSRDKSVWLWSVEGDSDFECLSVLHEHSQDVKSILWHPSSTVLFSCGYDDSIKCYYEDEDDWECYDTLEGHTSTIWDMAISKDGNRIVSCSDDCTLKVWKNVSADSSRPSYQCSLTVSGHHDRSIYSLEYNCDSTLIATGAGDNGVRVFEESDNDKNDNPAGNDTPLLILGDRQFNHKQDVNCVCWHPTDPSLLATCSDDRTIRLWTYTT